jgi:hypothetical protein
MSFTVVTSAEVLATALSVQRVASSTIPEALATCAPMSAIEVDSSSIAAATLVALAVVSSAAEAAARAWRCDSSRTAVVPRAKASSSVAACPTDEAMARMSRSNAPATASSAADFSASARLRAATAG